jgi:hypothetical protein
MTKNSPAILVATVLIFLARALEFQKKSDILDTAALASLFGAISWGLDRIVTRLVMSKGAAGLSVDWVPHLLFGWIVSLIIVILDNLSNTILYTKTFPQFFIGIANAVIVYSVLAVLVTFVKAKKFDHKTITLPVAYVMSAVLLNSVMLYLFIFA